MQRRQLGAVSKKEQSESTINRLQLRAVLDAIPDPVWLKSVEGRYSICNSQFERLAGVSEADLIGRTDYDLVDGRLADHFRENDRKALAAGEPRANEEWLTFACTGYRGFFETIKAPMRDPDGELIGVL